MSLRIVCATYLVRHPAGGHAWHHLQYLIGLKRLGCSVTAFEDFGWPRSCYDPVADAMTSDPRHGIAFAQPLFREHGLGGDWCYLAEDGTSFGLSRAELVERIAACDVYLDLSGVNRIPELQLARKRVLVDTDPVFTQIGAFGLRVPFESYHALFTYGENAHRPGCTMPTAGRNWLPTRQPVVTALWPSAAGDPGAALTTIVNWSSYGDAVHEGRAFGQKDREFEALFDLPGLTGEAMAVALNGPVAIRQRFSECGWSVLDPLVVAHDPRAYQRFIASSRGEFCVAKHAYVETRCGWFSDRTTGYLAMGRPAVVQDTGFSEFLPVGCGLLAFRTAAEAVACIERLRDDYPRHCRVAREIAELEFEAEMVLGDMLARVV